MISAQHDHIQKLIKLLTTAAANAALYHPEHYSTSTAISP